MYPTLNSVTAGGGLALPEFVILASRNGFAGVEFGIDSISEMGVEAARELFESQHVRPAAFGLPVEWRRDEEKFQSDLARLPALAQTARELGVDRCCTWVLPDGGEPIGDYQPRSQRRLIECAKVLSGGGVRLGLEFIGPKHFRNNPENVWFYDIPGALQVLHEMNEGGSGNIGLLVDCWHWYTSGGTVMDLASIPVDQIVHVHVNDAPRIERDEQVDSVRLLPGASGVIDIRGFLRTLSALGYDGPVAVETFSEELKNLTADEGAARAGAAMRKIFADAELPFSK